MGTYISVGVVTETLLFLKEAKQLNCFSLDEMSKLRKRYVASSVTIEFAMSCGWISVENESFAISSDGLRILQQFDGYYIGMSLWRTILRDYIVTLKPIWARRIPFGRKEAFLFMSDEEKRCFLEAGLMDIPANDEVIKWWDTIADIERENDDYLSVGREGERLTMEYETMRTGKRPVWQSIETNLAGYDIISHSDNTDDSVEILIEVKASRKTIQNAFLVITRHEWEVANYKNNVNRYYFYIWLLGDAKLLARISANDVLDHIPKESGAGTWENVKIPFEAFKADFEVVVA